MTWAVAEAKAKFSEVIDRAQQDGAQEITRNGKLVGILVSPDDWKKHQRQKLTGARTMSEFFKNSPLVDSGIDLRRSRSKVRKVEL